jgi:hypothetical protein
MRNAGLIQDYNYVTVGFDKQLIDFLRIDAKAFEARVLAGGSDEAFLAWTLNSIVFASERRRCSSAFSGPPA